MLLPRFAPLHGCDAALRLRDRVERHDFQAASWVALWPYLPDGDRARAFMLITPKERPERNAHKALALGKLAPALSPQQVRRATEWIVTHHSGGQAELLAPLIKAGCQLPPRQSYDVWDCIVTEAARLPRTDAAAYLCEAVPLTEHLGGAAALKAIADCLARATEQWP